MILTKGATMAHFLMKKATHTDHAANVAKEAAAKLQAELAHRANTFDAGEAQTFDSSMSKDDVRARFFAMVEHARESIYA